MELVKVGFEVGMIRINDIFYELSDCVKKVNSFKVDLFILFYFNVGGGKGYEDYIYIFVLVVMVEI